MLKHRLIALILLREGKVVQSVQFKHTNAIHYDPVHALESFNRWAIDEIVVLNVARNDKDAKELPATVQRISRSCFVPLTAGGWIRSVDDARQLLARGADKVVLNTAAFDRPELISELARQFGNQCIVVSIDAQTSDDGGEVVVVDRGRRPTGTKVVDWARQAEERGAGEILLNSIPHDGKRRGYHLDLLRSVSEAVNIPLIAMGGVLRWEHLAQGITEAGADAVAAANIFHYTEHSSKKAKRYLLNKGLNFRQL